MKPSCKTTQTDRVVTPRKSKQKSIGSTVAKETDDPDLVDLVAKTDLIVSEARVGLTKTRVAFFLSFCEGLTSGSWLVEEPFEGPEVFLVADAIHDGFHFGPGTYFTDGSKLYHPRRREVGWGFCSVTADLQLCTAACGPVTLDNATVPVAQLLAVIFLAERSDGPIHNLPNCRNVCSGKDKIAQRTERGAHVTLWSRLQQALSGAVEISWCKAHITSDNFHQFKSTPEILVGNAVADALAKKGASVFPAANDWVKMDQIAWAVQQAHLCHLAAQAAPRSVSALPEDVLLAARRIRKRECTILENASTHSLVPVGKGYHCRVCENSTPPRGALDWLRSTICSGSPSSHPADPVRVGRQMLHESHRLRFHRGVYWCTSCGQVA